MFTTSEEKIEKVQINKIEKCSHENKMIICTYSFCEIRGLCCFDCFKKNHISHSQDCYDKNLINITKENQTQSEERKKNFSKLIEYYSVKFDEVKQLIDKKMEYLKNLNNIEINDVFDIEKFEVFQIIKKCNLFQKNELDYNKLNEIFFNYYINSLFEIKNFNQSIVDNLIYNIIYSKNKIFITKFDKEYLYEFLYTINYEYHEINFYSKKDFVLTDIGVYGFSEESVHNNQNFTNTFSNNNIFNNNNNNNNNNENNTILNLKKNDFFIIKSIKSYDIMKNDIFKNSIKNDLNEIICIIKEDNDNLSKNNEQNIKLIQIFDKYVFNKIKYHNIKLNKNIKIEKGKNYQIIFKNIRNFNAMDAKENCYGKCLTILKYLTYEESFNYI